MIISGILTLCQHLTRTLSTPEDYRPARCPPCGMSGLHCHGVYIRKANRRGVAFETDEPIAVPRFRCPHCHATCSCLPEVIPPRRHYLWCWQQLVMLKWLGGMPLNAIAAQVRPSRKTIKRWLDRFNAQFLLHATILRSRFAEFGRTNGFSEFWRMSLMQIPLSSAMLHIYDAGTSIP